MALVIAAAACRAGAREARDAELRPQHAVDLVLSAFQRYPLVGLSEGAGHGQLETLDFFTALVRDPRFPRIVRNVVVEFGNARYQAVMDRYIAGEAIAPDQLQHVWEDTTQVTGIWSLPMYEEMFATIRSVNAALPPARRVRVLLGDPPIDWSAVTSPADEDMNDWRDAHFAHVVGREVMSRGETALLFIGGAHLGRKVIFPNSLVHLLDAQHPGRTWVVEVLDIERAHHAVAARFQSWRAPAGAPVRDTWFGQLDVQQIGFGLSTGVVQDDHDAILLLTKTSPRQQERPALDADYERELARRRALGEATQPFRGSRIRFEDGLAALAADASAPLESVLQELRRDRGLTLLVKAFADSTEPNATTLSTQRAELVAEWLVRRGIQRERLIPKGCGTRRPLTFGKTAADRALNRRAELVRLTPTAGCEPPW